MVAPAPITNETPTWDVRDAFPKLHSRAREAKTTPCTEAHHSKSRNRIEIWLTIYDDCVRLESFTRDPIGLGGNAWSLYEYAESRVISRLDPTGLAACTVRLVCAHLGFGKEHCGIETTTDGGNSWTRWHVHSPNAGMPNPGGAWDTCDVRPSRVSLNPPLIGQIPLEWHAYMEWHDPTGALCGCIGKEAANITAHNLPYWPVPKNGAYYTGGWPGKTYCHVYKTCNSNYSTHCMMKRCGITADRPKAPGWNHRIKDCTEWEKPCWYKNDCRCKTWENIDDDWCAEPPAPPILQGTPIDIVG